MLRSLGNFLTVTLLLAIALPAFCQEEEAGVDSLSQYLEGDTMGTGLITPAPPTGFLFKPTLGFGTGMFSFYGDISKGKKAHHPIVSRIGWDMYVSQGLTPWLDLNFYVLWGKLGANERSLDRNLNFESNITTGGATLGYNFHHLLPEKRNVEPYIAAGFESFEFLSKTDLYDSFGNQYHYWSDGSIRNLAENATNASDAIRLQRDYIYESDIRESNIDGFGKYAERSWAIPVDAGVHLHVTDKWKFRIGTSMHFTMTDLVDGVTENSLGNRKGDSGNDNFMFTHFSISYNLLLDKDDNIDGIDYSDIDFAMFDLEDNDEDGIIDFEDLCAQTPIGVEVDDQGCPLDADDDGVPDYLDKEIDTHDTAYVDQDGIALTDSMIELMYLMYMDSTGLFADINESESSTDADLVAKAKAAQRLKKKYVVKVAETNDQVGIPAELAEQLLSDPNLKTIEYDDGTTVFISGEYDSLPPAVKDFYEQKSKYPDVAVVTPGDGTDLDPVDISSYPPPDDKTATNPPPARSGMLFRVQIGAFRNKLSKNVFADVPGIVAVPGDDGLTRYYSPSYKTYKEAAAKKVDLMTEGFQGVFVVPFKDSKRISLEDAGATIVKGQEDAVKDEVKDGPTSVNKDLVKFKVQVAAHENQIPTDILEKLMSLGSVEAKKTVDGWTKYVIGNFSDYNSAQSYKEEIKTQGFDAFVVGEFNNKLISAQEAKDLLNE